MNSTQFRTILFGIFFFIPFVHLQSQSDLKEHPWWVNLGAGPSLIGDAFSMNAGMVYNYQFEKTYISARIIGQTNKNPTVLRVDPSRVQYKFSDFSVLYGPVWHGERSLVCLGAGIGLVRAAYETPEAITTGTSINLPLEAQLFWRPVSFAGIGLYVYAGLNFEKQLYGTMLCVQLGVW